MFKRYLFFIFFTILCQNLFGITITVNNTANAGVGSLRAAILNANPNDIIVFDETVFATPQTIALSATLDISINNLTIQGNGNVIISGELNVRVFNITGDNILLENLSISKGKTTGDGAGINFTGVNLTLKKCKVIDSQATNRGGAVYSTGKTTIQDLSILENNASSTAGGAIYSTSTLIIQNSQIIKNKALVPATGGGLYIDGGDVSIEKSLISENTAYNAAGFYINTTILLEIKESTIEKNEAAKSGGGVYIVSGTVKLIKSTFAENKALANQGGAIYNQGAILEISQSTFSANQANLEGGALYAEGGMNTINHTTFSGNASFKTGGGGGVYAFLITSAFTVENSIVANNSNGDFSLSDGTINITNCIIPIRNEGSGTINCTSCSTTDPQLMTFGDYGGNTKTFALQRTSPAINAAPSSTITSDQRNQAIVNVPDLGAFEFTDPEINLLANGNPITQIETFTFPETQVGNNSLAANFTIENTGTGFLILQENAGKFISITGTNPNDFIINESTLKDSINASESKVFTIQFSPTSIGNKTATITINSNDFDEPSYSFNLQGNAITASSACYLADKTPVISRVGDSLKVDLEANAYQWIVNGVLLNIVSQSIAIPTSGTFQVIAWEGDCSSEISAHTKINTKFPL